MLITAMGIIGVGMFLVLLRILSAPSFSDRNLAMNSFGSKTIILILLLSIFFDEPMLLDIGLVYALIQFVTSVAFLKYSRSRDLGGSL